LPGRPPESSAPLRRVKSRALRAASRARAASTALLMILRATVGVLLEIRAQPLVDEGLHDARDIGIQLALGLPFKLRLRQLHADHRHQPFAHVVTRQIFFDVLEQPHLLPGVIDGARQRHAEAGKMRASINVLMLLAKLNTDSEYPSLYCSPISMATPLRSASM
jgi:hypothetical protein